jgi:hypothetical protein
MALNQGMERFHAFALICFAALLGLFEGPAEIACVLALFTTAATGRLRGYRWTWAETGLLIWIGAGLYGLLTAESRPSSEDMFRPLLALAFIVGTRSLSGIPSSILKKILFAFVAAMMLNCAYGFLQFYLGEMPLDKWLLANPKSPQVHIPRHYGLRTVSGLFYNRLKLAHLAIIAMGALLVVPMTFRDSISKKIMAGAFLGTIIFLVAIVLTQARTALLAIGVAMSLSAILLARPKLIASLFAGSVLVGGLTLLMRFGVERLALVAVDIGIRAKIYGIGLQLFQEHPVFGLGHGMYRIYATAIWQADWAPSYLVDAHQLFLHVLVETGLVGFMGFMLAIGMIVLALARRVYRQRRASSESVALDRLAFFTLAAYLSLGIFHFPLHHASVALAFWFFLGLARFGQDQALLEKPPAEPPDSTKEAPLAS